MYSCISSNGPPLSSAEQIIDPCQSPTKVISLSPDIMAPSPNKYKAGSGFRFYSTTLNTAKESTSDSSSSFSDSEGDQIVPNSINRGPNKSEISMESSSKNSSNGRTHYDDECFECYETESEYEDEMSCKSEGNKNNTEESKEDENNADQIEASENEADESDVDENNGEDVEVTSCKSISTKEFYYNESKPRNRAIDESSEEDDDEEEMPDLASFFDDQNTGKYLHSVNKISYNNQCESRNSTYFGVSSDDLRRFQRNKAHEEYDDDSDDEYFCMTCYSMSAGLSYAFPKERPRSIEKLIKFWEKDFQVEQLIYPRMGSWESKGFAPLQNFHPDEDCFRYEFYKKLYNKWVKCNRSLEQWYEKYRHYSLYEIAHQTTMHRGCLKKKAINAASSCVQFGESNACHSQIIWLWKL